MLGTAIFFLVITTIAYIFWMVLHKNSSGSSETENFRTYVGWGTVLLLVVTAVFGVAASTTKITAPDVGVVVLFGKPIDSLPGGFHWKNPLAKVVKLEGAVQNNVYAGDQAVDIRLGNDSEATANVSVEWVLKSENAKDLYKDYRSFESIQNAMIDRNLRAALNNAAANYDPLNTITDDAAAKSALTELSDQVLEEMRETVGGAVDIRKVVIPKINYDKATQNRINELQSEIAKTRIAEQKLKTATAEAKANVALSESLTSEINIARCLDIISASGQSPLGCQPGTGAMPTIPVG